ncbi:uncharacterized protein [Nicotiana tomentosiformis]|uniref:uncharacterized protein n=1 Tax=Nicotiana tomentosiformis TaxID=4098 RepID=UPI00051B0F84|nr:uncharacterized protein LOC117275042 [Nicotiana tomentosiformis]
MDDPSTRMAELHKDVDALKGYVETVVNSVIELTNSIETRFAQALEEIRRMMINNGENPAPNGPVLGRDEEMLEARVPRSTENQNHVRNYQIDVAISRFNGTGLKNWFYKYEKFFDVDETPEGSKVKLASCKLEGRTLQWHQSFMKSRMTREGPRWGEYVRCLYARFGAELFDDPMDDFKNLRYWYRYY